MAYLFTAYTLIWVLLAGYLVFLTRKQNRVEAELEGLKQKLQQSQVSPDQASTDQPDQE